MEDGNCAHTGRLSKKQCFFLRQRQLVTCKHGCGEVRQQNLISDSIYRNRSPGSNWTQVLMNYRAHTPRTPKPKVGNLLLKGNFQEKEKPWYVWIYIYIKYNMCWWLYSTHEGNRCYNLCREKFTDACIYVKESWNELQNGGKTVLFVWPSQRSTEGSQLKPCQIRQGFHAY